MLLKFEIFWHARNHGKNSLNLRQTSFNGIVLCCFGFKILYVDTAIYIMVISSVVPLHNVSKGDHLLSYQLNFVAEIRKIEGRLHCINVQSALSQQKRR